MIGGIVEAIAPQEDILRITVIGTGWESSQITSIHLKKKLGTEYLQPGDYIWWQWGQAYWTPLKTNRLGLNFLIRQWNLLQWNHTIEDYPLATIAPCGKQDS